ncbi:MAG: nucleotidyltransferase family protein [Acidobacteria bacterium]|nr:nucleotidyltransferase family protein [Acidobacteriota bacterium]
MAAGRSRRMGAFKPLLPFGAKTVIESCVDNLRAAGVSEIVVVVGHRADELRAHLSGPGLRFALNDDGGSEMGASIARGVERVSGEAAAVLVALADHPAVTPDAIRFLLDTRETTGARAVVPTWQGRGGHPVLVDLSLRDELLRLEESRGLRGLLEAHAGEVLRVEVECPFVARDMDSWDDYRALHAEVFGTEPPPGGSSS